MTAHTPHDAELLSRAGADLVLEPFSLAAEKADEILTRLTRNDEHHTKSHDAAPTEQDPAEPE